MSDTIIPTDSGESRIQESPYRASTTVFSIPELLESIFHQLPLREVLKVQRVCHRWRDFITNSPSLQEALFFRPTTDRLDEPVFNPLLQSLFPPLFDITAIGHANLHGPNEFKDLSWYKNPVNRNNVMMEDASWRKMYPVQPPAKVDEIVLNKYCCCDWWNESLTIANPHQHEQEAGAKMELVFDALVAVLDVYDWHGFVIVWGMFPVRGANGQSDIDSHQWLMEKKGYAKENFGVGSYITIYEQHQEECFGAPYKDEVPITGLRIRDVQRQTDRKVGNVNLPSFLE